MDGDGEVGGEEDKREPNTCTDLLNLYAIAAVYRCTGVVLLMMMVFFLELDTLGVCEAFLV